MTADAVKKILDEFAAMYRERFLPPDEVDPDEWVKLWVNDLADFDDETGQMAADLVRRTLKHPPVAADLYAMAETHLGWHRPALPDFWDRLRLAIRRDKRRAREMFGPYGAAIHCGFPDDPPLNKLEGPEDEPQRKQKDAPNSPRSIQVNDKTVLVNLNGLWTVKRDSRKMLLGEFDTPQAALTWVKEELQRRGQTEEAKELEGVTL